MLDVVQGQVELVIVCFRPAAVFRATVVQHADQSHTLLLEEWQDTVVEQVGRGDRRLGRIELGGGPLRIRVDKGLLVNAPDALDGADVKRVLAAELTGGLPSRPRRAPHRRPVFSPVPPPAPR